MRAPTHKTALRCLALEADCLRQALRCSREDEVRARLEARVADLNHSILALGLAEGAAEKEGEAKP